MYVWELDLKIKQFFLREPSEIIWRLKRIEELKIKKNWWAILAKGRSAHKIVSIRASLWDKIDFYRIIDKKKNKSSWNYWNLKKKVFHPLRYGQRKIIQLSSKNQFGKMQKKITQFLGKIPVSFEQWKARPPS